MSRVAVLKGGRSLERQVSLRSGARVEAALAGSATRWSSVDVGLDLVRGCGRPSRTSAFVALHGRDGEDGTVQEMLEILGVPYTGLGRAGLRRAMDKVLAKHLMVAAGIPTPEFFAFSETAFRDLGAAEALPAIEERLAFPIVVKPSSQGSALGIKFAATAADVPGALWSPRSPTTPRCCSSATWRGASWRCRCWTASPCRWWRRSRRRTASMTSRSRYDIGATDFVCPPELPAGVTERATRWPWRPTSCSAWRASAAST